MRYPTMSGADPAGVYGAGAPVSSAAVASAALEERKVEPVAAAKP